jgi:ATP-binding cassette, subfamily B, bacterial
MLILISHRFSTMRVADYIDVLESGRITESGTHGELVHRGGKYAQFFEIQAASYR